MHIYKLPNKPNRMNYSYKFNQMQQAKATEKFHFRITSTTWYKESHSLYDYQSTKVINESFQFPLTCKGVNIYRKKNASDIVAFDSSKKISNLDLEQFEFLTYAELETSKSANRVRINLYNSSTYKDKYGESGSQKLKTNTSIEEINEHEEQAYLVVSKLKNANDVQIGCKLVPGMTLKFGRIEYFVSQYSDGQKVVLSPRNNRKTYFNDSVLKYSPLKQQDRNACKICLDENQTPENFLFLPCACFGSCGTVHFECLLKWIHIKIAKEAIGGTLHYNFQKFECEVCKKQFPAYIDVNGQRKELLSLERPAGNYLILEGACEKQKCIMIIQNTPADGIKLGRGHDCQIRIADISVSRKHAVIKNINQQFFVYDNKSKFGTLAREDTMKFQLKREKKSVQIGRSVLDFEICRQKM